jgi:hypothetical protein
MNSVVRSDPVVLPKSIFENAVPPICLSKVGINLGGLRIAARRLLLARRPSARALRAAPGNAPVNVEIGGQALRLEPLGSG